MSAAIVPALANPRVRASAALSMAGLVGCYLGVRFCLTFLFFQSDPKLGATVGVAINILLMIPVAIYAFGAAELPLRTILRNSAVRLVFSYLALALISLLWSETSSTAVAFTYWTALGADVLLVLLLIRSDGIELAAESLLKGYVCGVALLCLVAWCAPTMQDLRLGDDEFLTPNGIGFECAVAVLLCQYFAPQGARWKWLGALFALTLLRSLSKTTIAAFVIAEAFYLFQTTLFSRSTKIKVVTFAVLVTLAFSGLLANYYTIYINAGNQAETLTGRTSIWIVTLGYPAIEHIVLDGCSTDGSQRILQDFEKTSGVSEFWWRSASDEGQSAALNEGFARASGEIVGWLNADDRYRAGCFQAVAAAFAEHPELDVLYGDYNLMDAAGNQIAVRREIEFSRFILRYHRVLYIPTTATFFRRRVFEHGHRLSNSLHYAMDLEFFLRLADAGCRFQHLPEVLADFRVHSASKSVAFRSRQRAEHRRVVLQTTPLAHCFHSPGLRNLAAASLQIPAALLRYSEKLFRGFYFPSSRATGQRLPVPSRPEQS